MSYAEKVRYYGEGYRSYGFDFYKRGFFSVLGPNENCKGTFFSRARRPEGIKSILLDRFFSDACFLARRHYVEILRNYYFCPFGKVFLEKLCRVTTENSYYAMMKIGIKYCGGCNPKFDRMAFARRLKEAFGHGEVQAVNNDNVFDSVDRKSVV